MSRVPRSQLLLACVVLAGGCVRSWQLGALGFNSDEAVYAGQAAALTGDPALSQIFPVFRAHPLLVQFTTALAFRWSVSDVVARAISVAFGLATIIVVYRLARLLYGKQAGLLAALFLSLMPYHVVITRQALLDGPMTFFATLSLYLLATFVVFHRSTSLYAAGAAMGLTFLAKETGIVLLGSVHIFLALSPEVRFRLRDLSRSLACLALVIAPFPVSLVLAGGMGAPTTRQYIVWQLFRRPNHTAGFYLTSVPPAIGVLLIAIALLGLWLSRRQMTWREKLLLAWIVVPTLYFQLWPVKGFHYLLPIAPPIAILGARGLLQAVPARRMKVLGRVVHRELAGAGAVLAVVAALGCGTWQHIEPSPTVQFLAGSGGVPGGREAGQWVRDHLPPGATLMTIGPSMANILQFYGHRKARGLSVSPNPLHRNPSYLPITNPDLELRNGEIQYLVWDSFSAARSSFFAEKLLSYAERYRGRVAHVESVEMDPGGGDTASVPVIIIYEVSP